MSVRIETKRTRFRGMTYLLVKRHNTDITVLSGCQASHSQADRWGRRFRLPSARLDSTARASRRCFLPKLRGPEVLTAGERKRLPHLSACPCGSKPETAAPWRCYFPETAAGG